MNLKWLRKWDSNGPIIRTMNWGGGRKRIVVCKTARVRGRLFDAIRAMAATGRKIRNSDVKIPGPYNSNSGHCALVQLCRRGELKRVGKGLYVAKKGVNK